MKPHTIEVDCNPDTTADGKHRVTLTISNLRSKKDAAAVSELFRLVIMPLLERLLDAKQVATDDAESDVPEAAYVRQLEGLALDMQLLMSGQTLRDAYNALLPAMVNWIVCASQSKEDAVKIARSVANDIERHTLAGYDHVKHSHAQVQVDPVTKRN